MKELKKKLEKVVGKKCKEYNPFCFVCINYDALAVLEHTFEIYHEK